MKFNNNIKKDNSNSLTKKGKDKRYRNCYEKSHSSCSSSDTYLTLSLESIHNGESSSSSCSSNSSSSSSSSSSSCSDICIDKGKINNINYFSNLSNNPFVLTNNLYIIEISEKVSCFKNIYIYDQNYTIIFNSFNHKYSGVQLLFINSHNSNSIQFTFNVSFPDIINNAAPDPKIKVNTILPNSSCQYVGYWSGTYMIFYKTI